MESANDIDSHLDGIRCRILATIPLPNLQTVYAMICAEANRQDAMLGWTSNERVVMAARKSFARSDSRKGVRKCTHCNGDDHVVDECFKPVAVPRFIIRGRNFFLYNLKNSIE